MKKKISILFLTISTLVILAIEFVPHHHHGDSLSIITASCCHDCSDCHEQEANHCHSEDGSEQHNDACIVKSFYLPAHADEKEQIAFQSGTDNLNIAWLAPAVFAINLLIPQPEASTPKQVTKPYLIFYTSSFVCPSNGLRAPPHFFI